MNHYKTYLIPLALLGLALCAAACRTKRHTTNHTTMQSQRATQISIQRDSTAHRQLSETGSATQYLVQHAIEIKPEGTVTIYRQERRQSRDSTMHQQVRTTVNEQLQARADETVIHEASEETHVERTVPFRYGWLVFGAIVIGCLIIWIKQRFRI